jgi:hypothetical protein
VATYPHVLSAHTQPEGGDTSSRHDPDRADDDEYLEEKYWEVQNSIQQGMDALARKRALPLFG